MKSICPELVILNGRVWTGDPRRPQAEAFAIAGNRIVAVDSTERIASLCGPHTEVFDAARRRVLPGFNDSHVHFYWGGSSLNEVQLGDARSAEDMRDRVAAFARTKPKGAWITGGGWDPENWPAPVEPTHLLIDSVTPDHPVFLRRLDAHSSLANSLAMKLAGVDRTTPDVAAGEIGRFPDGAPNGIFRDAAKLLIERAIPPTSRDAIREAVLAAQTHAAALGVTSVHDMGLIRVDGNWAEILRVYQQLLSEDRLKIRICAHHRLPVWKDVAACGISAGFGNARLRLGYMKGFSDGSLGSATAWFLDPYCDLPESCGMPSDEMMDVEQMYANMRGADAAGLALSVHAIGDRANRVVLDLYERLRKENGPRPRRCRIEHAQHLQAEDIPRFARTGVIASMQPYHAIDDGRWAGRRLGPERARTSYPVRSLLDAGARVSFGTDWPVAPLNPLETIYAAVTRSTLDGRHPEGWMPEQRISVAEAVSAYTAGSAYASGEEKEKGAIEPGKLADAIVLSDDIFAIPPAAIRDVRVDATVFDGRIIYRREGT